MDWNEKIEEIIKSGKWIKNDIGMARIQCSKLIKDNEELGLFISSDVYNEPVYARVERIVVANNEVIIFYDNEYESVLEEKEYEDYSDLFSIDEWNALFGGETVEKLKEMNLISEKEGFYVETHESIESYINHYDEIISEDICEHFNL